MKRSLSTAAILVACLGVLAAFAEWSKSHYGPRPMHLPFASIFNPQSGGPGYPVTLTFGNSGLVDGGNAVSQSFLTGAAPVSAVVTIAEPASNLGGAAGTVEIWVSDDNVNFAPVPSVDAGFSVLNGGSQSVSVSTGATAPYGYAEVVEIPTFADAGVISGSAALGR